MEKQEKPLEVVEETEVTENPPQPKAKPSYWPPCSYKLPEDLKSRIDEEIAAKNQDLQEKERLLIAAVLDSKIHGSYYQEWLKDVGKLMRLVVRLTKRLKEVQNLPVDAETTNVEEKTSENEPLEKPPKDQGFS